MARAPRSVTAGLALLGGALALFVVSLFLEDVWAALLSALRMGTDTAVTLHTVWIPLTALAVDLGTAFLGALGFGLLWSGRQGLGVAYASRAGLGLLAFLVAVVAFALLTATGVLLGFFAGFRFLVPWHDLLAVAGSVAVGFALYVFLANLPLAGARPLAAAALALGISGIALANLRALTLSGVHMEDLYGAGFGLSLASVVLWLVLCLWGGETLRGGGSGAAASVALPGS